LSQPRSSRVAPGTLSKSKPKTPPAQLTANILLVHPYNPANVG
jgi:hypothetical protein